MNLTCEITGDPLDDIPEFAQVIFVSCKEYALDAINDGVRPFTSVPETMLGTTWSRDSL